LKFKSIFISFLLSIIVMTALLRTGRPPEPEIVIPHITGDLDTYLSEKESLFSDLREGAEKKIIWLDPLRKQRTRYALIYLHGFSATRQETAPLCDQIAQQLDANLFYTRLTGHGRSSNAMAEATLHAWQQDAVEALTIGRHLGEQVIVVGTSTGGTLATWLTHEDNSNRIAALVLISPNFAPQEAKAKALNWPGAELFVPLFWGKEYSWRPHNNLHARYWTTTYPTSALFTMTALVRMANTLDFASINVPTLFVYSDNDKVVDVERTKYIYEELFPRLKRDRIEVSSSGDPLNHILAGDALSPDNTKPLADEIVLKLNRLLAL
jgi:esterase/lipase